jgi:hypothetical protein
LLHALALEADVRSVYVAVLLWVGVRAVTGARGAAAARVVAMCFAAAALAAVCSALLR